MGDGTEDENMRNTEEELNSFPISRVIPIVLSDGSVIGGEMQGSNNDFTNNLQENHLAKVEEGIENIHVEISEKVIEISENVEMMSALQAESQADFIENDVKEVRDNISSSNNHLPPIMTSTKFIQKSNLEARRKNPGTEQASRRKAQSMSTLSENRKSMKEQDIQKTGQSINDLQHVIIKENDSARKQVFQTSTLPRRITQRGKSSCSVQPTAKVSVNPSLRNSAHQVGHSSVSLEALNPKYVPPTTHFGFFPKTETRPGAITPVYGQPRVYRSARNLTSNNTSEQNINKAQKISNNGDEESNISYTLPRGWKTKNKRNVIFNENQRILSDPQSQYSSTNRYPTHNNMPSESRRGKVQSVQGVPRGQTYQADSNPFLNNMESKEKTSGEIWEGRSYKENLKSGSASDIYWASLDEQRKNKEKEEKSSLAAADASTQTQTVRDKKKSGCKIM